ncbi:unnamed protein product [Bursaphelenchus xylophilus]|uniref:(pine wood nematode) hypothetical protein n=1 Tax=Bursaphelenchus xylophilus TaxID=6326 RepID=A0A1I7SB47_BURXY|nr:unnamed protein product [Bursaphelenchus xylophilus]CAG9131739.1 unnamed protein product [Bursaphelenchus xylophilus]
MVPRPNNPYDQGYVTDEFGNMTDSPRNLSPNSAATHQEVLPNRQRRRQNGRGPDRMSGELAGTQRFIRPGGHYHRLAQKQTEQIEIFSRNPEVQSFDYTQFKMSQKAGGAFGALGFDEITPIQQIAIPFIKRFTDSDFVIRSPMGYGKTWAFMVPIVDEVYERKQYVSPHLINKTDPYAVVLAPTRELAMQLYENTKSYVNAYGSRVKCAFSVGKQHMKSAQAEIESGCDILFVTHGRLIHHFINNKESVIKLGFQNLKYFVMDEGNDFYTSGADYEARMELKEFFSRMDREKHNLSSKYIQSILVGANINIHSYELFSAYVRSDYIGIQVGNCDLPAETLHNEIIRIDDPVKKIAKLIEILTKHGKVEDGHFVTEKTIVFVNTVRDCTRVLYALNTQRFSALGLSSDHTQVERKKALDRFNAGEYDIMVATDIGSKGLNILDLAITINYGIPNRDNFNNRVGRVGRMGNEGKVYHFYVPSEDHQHKAFLREVLQAQSNKIEIPDFLQ